MYKRQVVYVVQVDALDVLGQIELVERCIRTEFTFELGLRSHFLKLAIDERPVLHVVFEG